MKLHIYGVCCAVGLLFAADMARAEEFYSTPITSATAESTWGDTQWGPAGDLIPASEWKMYVHRPSAFSGNPDPARMPVLGGGRTAMRSGTVSGSKSGSVATRSTAPKPKVDPCEEKVRQALEEAARTGKIPASAVPPSPSSGNAPMVNPPAGSPPVSGQGQVSGQISLAPGQPSQVTGAAVPGQSSGSPYTAAASSVAPPGASAQGAPNPQFGGGRSTPPFSVN